MVLVLPNTFEYHFIVCKTFLCNYLMYVLFIVHIFTCSLRSQRLILVDLPICTGSLDLLISCHCLIIFSEVLDLRKKKSFNAPLFQLS